MSAHSKQHCSACGQREAPERPITAQGEIAVCDACIAGLVDARNAERLQRFPRALWLRDGLEHLVLRRGEVLDGRLVKAFVRDCAAFGNGAETVRELLDAYTWFRDQERQGTFELFAVGMSASQNPITPELLDVFRALPLIEWRVAEAVPLRIEKDTVVCASARGDPLDWVGGIFQAELQRPVRMVSGLQSAIRERLDLLKIHAQERQPRAA